MRILIVEDEAEFAALIQQGLQTAGLDVELCADGRAGLVLASTEAFDAIVLDINLPGLDGLEILTRLRKRKFATPVLILTARSELNDRVEGLQLGADDYLTKPFFIEELHARLLALIRRSSGQARTCYELGSLRLDPHARSVTSSGQPMDLTQREFSLLEILMRSPGRVFTRAHIGQHIWDSGVDVGTNMIDITLSRLRKKLAAAGAENLIQTRRGVGYLMQDRSQ